MTGTTRRSGWWRAASARARTSSTTHPKGTGVTVMVGPQFRKLVQGRAVGEGHRADDHLLTADGVMPPV